MADRLAPSEELRQRSLPLKDQRHLTPTTTLSIPVARNHRRWLARDIDRLLTRSYDPSLSADELGALNELINEKVKERREWEKRLVELGGVLEDFGGWSGGDLGGGYHYFGRAKELLKQQPDNGGTEDDGEEQHERSTGRKRQGLLYQLVNAEYYGFHRSSNTTTSTSTSDDYIPQIPTNEDINRAILRAKKAALLARLDAL
jgi:hypothetical protein